MGSFVVCIQLDNSDFKLTLVQELELQEQILVSKIMRGIVV